jgi:hypothetical protein
VMFWSGSNWPLPAAKKSPEESTSAGCRSPASVLVSVSAETTESASTSPWKFWPRASPVACKRQILATAAAFPAFAAESA